MRKRFLWSKLLVFSGILLLSGSLLTGCGGEAGGDLENPANPAVQLSDPSKNDTNVTNTVYAENSGFSGVQNFSWNLLARSMKEVNPVESPVSAYTALSLAETGAKGQTEAEFNNVMGQDRQAQTEALMGRLPADREDIKVQIANSAWVNNDMNCEQEWLAVAQNAYRADVFQAVLSSGATMGRINDWVEDRTHGMIKDFLKEPLSEDTKLVLFNTVYFKGKWVSTFEKKNTAERSFILEDGKEVKVPMMSRYNENMTYVSTNDCEGVVLPYRDTELVYVALKPKNGKTVRQMYENMDLTQIDRIVKSAQDVKVDLWLPRYEVTFDKVLNEDLTAMGLVTAFDREQADFTGIGFTEKGLPLYISEVRQKAVFIVDEEGTEAAAVTEVAMDECAGIMKPETPIEMHFDSPFLYMILDKETAVPLFLGIMDDPSQAQVAE